MARKKISDLTLDPKNANRGTQRGRGMLERSLRQYGAGRSILLDKKGRIIAGNKMTEAAAEIGIDDLIVVPSDGTKLVAVQRTDLDLDEPAARGLAYADNRVGQVDLDWDASQLLADVGAGIDLSTLFFDAEINELLSRSTPPANEPAQDAARNRLLDQAIQLKPAREYVVILCETADQWTQLKQFLALEPVRRGGYRPGSQFDAVGIQRVVKADFILENYAHRDAEQGPVADDQES